MSRVQLGKAILMSNFRRLRMPYKISLALTYRCNARCLTCKIWKRRPEDELSLEEIEKFFSKNNHFSWINLTGGEVLLHKNLGDILECILDECKNLVLLNFPTNGLLAEAAVDAVGKISEDPRIRKIITVSVDGPEEINDEIRGVPNDFSKSVESYRRLQSLNRDDLDVLFGITLSEHNAGRLEETYNALKQEIPSMDPQDIHVNIAHYSSHYYSNSKKEDIPQTNKQAVSKDITWMLSHIPSIPRSTMRYIERRYLRNILKYLETGQTPLPCHALSSSCFIDPQGTVYPCIAFDKPLGNLREVDFRLDKIWNAEATQELQDEIKMGECPNCWLACEAYQSILGGLLR